MKEWQCLINNEEKEFHRLEINTYLIITISKYKTDNVTPKGWFCQVPVSITFGTSSNIILNYDMTSDDVKKQIIKVYIKNMQKEIQYKKKMIAELTPYLLE